MKTAFKLTFRSIPAKAVALAALVFFAAGCAATPTPTPSASATKQATYFEPQVSPPSSTETGTPTISLTAGNFTGEIFLDTASATPVGNGFSLPVYLKNVTLDDAVDTITLKTFLPEGIRLRQVITPSGFTAQLDGLETPSPVVYFHSLSLTPDSYSPVIATTEPIFTLVFSGPQQGKIAAEGSYLRKDAMLLRTNRAVLEL